MEIDGGNLDDDSIEREWQQLTVITSLPFHKDGEADGKSILRNAIYKCVKDHISRHKDIANHFIYDKKINAEEFINQHVDRIMSKSEATYINAEISKNTSKLSKDETLKLKEDINAIMNDVPLVAMCQMVKSWHCFRME